MIYAITFLLLILFIVSLYNLYSAPRIKNKKCDLQNYPLVSVLIPARNEENTIWKLLNSLTTQSYTNIEITVLDDNSTDYTIDAIMQYVKDFFNIKIIKGKPLPEGWKGKNWACHQLSEIAAGNILLFIDADVYLSKYAIENAVNDFQKDKLKMLSVFPTQHLTTFGEWLIVPLMNWLLLSMLPLKKVFTSKNRSFVAANGQFVMWDKDSYNKIGGHQKVKDEIVEDMEMARLAKDKNLNVKTLLGWKAVFCKMYNDYSEAFKGFTKNFFPGFKLNTILFLIFIFILFIINVYPFIGIFFSKYFLIPIIILLLTRIFISLLSRQNLLYNILLHPFQFLFFIIIGINSIIQTKTGSIEWKGRNYKR